MRARGGNGVGRFSVEFEVANYGDIIRAKDGTLAPDQVRRQTISGVVDPGARSWYCRKRWSSNWVYQWGTRLRSVTPMVAEQNAARRKGRT